MDGSGMRQTGRRVATGRLQHATSATRARWGWEMPALRSSLAAAAVAATLLCVAVPAADAATVMRVDGSKVTRVDDPSVPSRGAGDLGRMPAGPPPAAGAAQTPKRKKKKGPTRGEKAVDRALKAAVRRRGISRKAEASYRKTYRLARSRRDRLKGQRKRELNYVVTTLEAIALRRQLTASRMKPLFLIVQRNAQFWLRSPFPGQPRLRAVPRQPDAVRVLRRQGPAATAAGQLQEGQRAARRLREAHRGRGLQPGRRWPGCWTRWWPRACAAAGSPRTSTTSTSAGRPPWISGMATATGIQAFGRAGQLLNTTKWRKYVQRGLRRVHDAGPHRRADARAAGRHALPAVLHVPRGCTSRTRCCSR